MREPVAITFQAALPAGDAGELRELLTSLKLFSDDVLTACPLAGLRIDLTYQNAEGFPQVVRIIEKDRGF